MASGVDRNFRDPPWGRTSHERATIPDGQVPPIARLDILLLTLLVVDGYAAAIIGRLRIRKWMYTRASPRLRPRSSVRTASRVAI